MKIPEKVPDINKLGFDDQKIITQLVSNQEIGSLIKKANRRYLYWDKFKYLVPKDLIEPRLAWFYLKLNRRVQAEHLSLKDKNDEHFNFWLPNQIQEYLHFVDKYAGGQISLDEPIINKESRDRYLVSSLMEEAISSSILEGAATTRKKAKEMLVSGKKPTSRADKMINNNYQTIRELRSFKDQPLTVELLNDLHRTITYETFDDPGISGRFRNENDGDIVVEDDQGNTLFVPPPVHEIEDRVNELIKFANDDHSTGSFIHPVIKAVILHFYLAYIHPYVDGNGRTARALFYWFMLKQGYWLIEYVSISRIILKAASQYVRAYLYTESDDQDLTYFISYHLKTLRLGFQELQAYIARKQKVVKLISDALRLPPDLNPRQSNLIQHALRHPGYPYTIQKHKIYHGVTYQTARTDLLGLVEKKMMDQTKRGKAFYFSLNKDLEKVLEQ